MGVIIQTRDTDEARRELWSFTNAFPAIYEDTDEAGNLRYLVFDPDEAQLYEAMEHNALIGTYNPLDN